jgi:hypothetical protein
MAQRADPGADARTEARGGGVVAITIVVAMALVVVQTGHPTGFAALELAVRPERVRRGAV